MTQAIEEASADTSTAQWVHYEFPLNERVRTLLRLEDLFAKYEFFLHKDHRLDHHAALLTVFEIIEVGSRADLKSDLLQELDRQKVQLATYREHPSVDPVLLDNTLAEIDLVASELNNCNGRLGYHLRDNEFLMMIRSRCAIPGGVCEFDLPGYHKWQSRPPQLRRADIVEWVSPMVPLMRAMHLVLKILRNSGEGEVVTSENGNFTQQMSGKVFQLLKVDIPNSVNVIPEFSANKYMLWIRFNVPIANTVSKNNPHSAPFDFRIRLCNL